MTGDAAIEQAAAWGVAMSEPIVKARRAKGIGCRVVESKDYSQCATCGDVSALNYWDDDDD